VIPFLHERKTRHENKLLGKDTIGKQGDVMGGAVAQQEHVILQAHQRSGFKRYPGSWFAE